MMADIYNAPPDSVKKFVAVITDADRVTRVAFGRRGYEDYTIHKDYERMRRYVARHENGRENHGKSGVRTAGFWARWLLWGKPSLRESAIAITKKFGFPVRIHYNKLLS